MYLLVPNFDINVVKGIKTEVLEVIPPHLAPLRGNIDPPPSLIFDIVDIFNSNPHRIQFFISLKGGG